jgi:hypothetical protein
MDLAYFDDAVGRLRNSRGQFVSWDAPTDGPDETCPNGCERYGDWWVPEDCPIHLGGA